ncbi:MAG: prepilin-type N-terminal cleavage/methylation domain-containing protein [Christensenellales bacterium]
MFNLKLRQNSQAFTIVELLVVIVVIGILASITIVAYSGIAQRANIVAMESDLSNASTQLKLYHAENGSYPATLDANNCPLTPVATTRYCLKSSSTSSEYTYTPENTTNPHSYSLISTDSAKNLSYIITDNTGPVAYEAQANGWKQISSGDSHTCGVVYNNLAYCWGYDTYGQLGNNSTGITLVPVAVDASGVLSGKTIKSIASGYEHSCAIASDDLAYCWGNNSNGQLGNNSNTTSLVPVAVFSSGALSGKTIKHIASGGYTTCAIASDDKAYCWGNGDYGQLGNNSVSESWVPVAVDTSGVLNGKTVKAMAVGWDYSCTIASDDLAYCWGHDGSDGRLGDNSTTNRQVPVAVYTLGVLSGKTTKSISATDAHTCVIASDDKPYCWGLNNYGQLGNNLTSSSLEPAAVDMTGVLSGKTIKHVSVGYEHTCAIASDNLGYCWGRNSSGHLGNNSTVESHVPVAVYTSGIFSGKTLLDITSSYSSTCAIASDNNSYCWGYNGSRGRFGDGTTISSLIPVLTVDPTL